MYLRLDSGEGRVSVALELVAHVLSCALLRVGLVERVERRVLPYTKQTYLEGSRSLVCERFAAEVRHDD